MTTGSWNRDAFSYYPSGATSGPWIGRKWSRTWSGLDYGEPPVYEESTDKEMYFVGFGAAHARKIFAALAAEARDLSRADFALQKDRNHTLYLQRKEKAKALKEARLEAAFNLYLARLQRLAAQKKMHVIEKEWRKIHHVPFPKALLTAKPPRDFIPRSTLRLKVPSRSMPKPPKRARMVDHPYTMTETRMEDVLVRHPTDLWSTPNTWITGPVMNGFSQPSWAPANLLTSNDQIALVNKLREKLQGSSFNAAVFLAEGNESLRLIGDTAIRIQKSFFHVVEGDYWGAARSLLEGTTRAPLAPRHSGWGQVTRDSGEIAARILELQYGYKPLLGDVYDGARALAHRLNYPYVQSYKVSTRRELSGSGQPGWSCYMGPKLGYVTQSAHNAFSKTHRRSIIARVKESDLPTLPDALGLLDPEVVVWEKIPFSFVADWFLPIGPYLQARASVSRLKGTFVTSDKMLGRNFPPTSDWWVLPFGFGGYSAATFTRTVSTTLAVPMPTVKSLSQAGSFQHCLNGLALVTSFFAGFSKIK